MIVEHFMGTLTYTSSVVENSINSKPSVKNATPMIVDYPS